MYFKLVIGFLLLQYICADENLVESSIKSLRTELFKNRGYDPMALPVKNHSHSVNVELSLSLINILDVDVNSHMVTIEVWLQMSWSDHHLTWKESDYDNINVIRVSPEEVFIPDIMLYNAADIMTMKDSMIKTNVLLYSNGMVLWIPPSVLKFFCDMDLTDWPYDQHDCFMKFGSWTHDGLAINVSIGDKEQIDLSDYWENHEWQVLKTSAARNTKYYACCPEPYPDVTFNFTIGRKSSLYHYTTLLPTTTAVFLSLLSFWFGIRSIIRFAFSFTSLLMLTIILLYLGSKFSLGTASIPFPICYIGKTIFAVGMTLVWSALAYNLINVRLRMPDLIRYVTSPAQRILLRDEDDSDGLAMTEDQTLRVSPKAEKSLKVLIILIDKIVFAIFFIVVISYHI